jgi:hypothetical protein
VRVAPICNLPAWSASINGPAEPSPKIADVIRRAHRFCRGEEMSLEHKGVEYTVVQMVDGTGWRWEVRFGGSKNKSGVTPISRAAARKIAEHEIDRIVRDDKSDHQPK